MSTESTARTPLPYRFVRLWVSTIVVCSMPTTLGSPGRSVVSREIDLWDHPRGRGGRDQMGPNGWDPSSQSDHSRTNARVHVPRPRNPSSWLSALSPRFVAEWAPGPVQSPLGAPFTPPQ